MPTTRRNFLAATGLASTGLLLPTRIWAAVPGARAAAPARPPSADAAALDALGASALLAGEKPAQDAIDAAVRAGASYVDARVVSWRGETVSVRDDHISGIRRSKKIGIGVRVLVDGAWGFAATNALDSKAARDAAARAVATARVNASLRNHPVELAAADIVRGRWVSPHVIDPFTVPIEDKAGTLIAATKAALAVDGVRFASASVETVREEKLFLSSEGSRTHQLFVRVLPAMNATAVDRRHGRFASRGHEVQAMLAGWEHVQEARLEADAPRVAQQALQKLHAKSVEPGKRTVILAPSNLWLTIHESIGHPTELDRALGLEANFAGTSFLTPKDTGKLDIGSKRVTLLADRTQPGGLATAAWDDDGVPTQRWPIVDAGKFVGWQTTRDQAGWIGEARSRGCSYGEGHDGVAFQRMPNISLQPGEEGHTTEDLINATDDGILISGRGSWSIDHQRYNFQFGGQFFWEIKNGRLTRPLRDVAYQSNTTEFWRSCDMLGGIDTYRLGGSFHDGKGEPGQSNAVSHGCPPGRFEVNIVNTGEGN